MRPRFSIARRARCSKSLPVPAPAKVFPSKTWIDLPKKTLSIVDQAPDAAALLAGAWDFFRLGVPSMLQMMMEWWGLEILTLLSGWLPEPAPGVGRSANLAAMGVLLSFVLLAIALPLGVSVAAATRVGNALGAGLPAAAKRAAVVGVAIAFAAQCGLAGGAFAGRRAWAALFIGAPTADGGSGGPYADGGGDDSNGATTRMMMTMAGQDGGGADLAAAAAAAYNAAVLQVVASAMPFFCIATVADAVQARSFLFDFRGANTADPHGGDPLITVASPVLFFAKPALFQLQVVLSGALRGAGQQAKCAAANAVAFYAVGTPVAVLLAFWRGWGVPGLAAGFAAGAVTQAGLLGALLLAAVDWRAEAARAVAAHAAASEAELLEEERKAGGASSAGFKHRDHGGDAAERGALAPLAEGACDDGAGRGRRDDGL